VRFYRYYSEERLEAAEGTWVDHPIPTLEKYDVLMAQRHQDVNFLEDVFTTTLPITNRLAIPGKGHDLTCPHFSSLAISHSLYHGKAASADCAADLVCFTDSHILAQFVVNRTAKNRQEECNYNLLFSNILSIMKDIGGSDAAKEIDNRS